MWRNIHRNSSKTINLDSKPIAQKSRTGTSPAPVLPEHGAILYRSPQFFDRIAQAPHLQLEACKSQTGGRDSDP